MQCMRKFPTKIPPKPSVTSSVSVGDLAKLPTLLLTKIHCSKSANLTRVLGRIPAYSAWWKKCDFCTPKCLDCPMKIYHGTSKWSLGSSWKSPAMSVQLYSKCEADSVPKPTTNGMNSHQLREMKCNSNIHQQCCFPLIGFTIMNESRGSEPFS